MSNLLPHADRKRIWSLYRSRFLVAASLLLAATAALAALALLPSYLALEQTPQTHTSSASPARAEDRAQLSEAQALLGALSSMAPATTSPSQALIHALSLKPSAITIAHASYVSGTIVLSGSARSPADLDAYRKTLSNDPLFASVTVPVEDLVGVSGGSFTMTLSGTY